MSDLESITKKHDQTIRGIISICKTTKDKDEIEKKMRQFYESRLDNYDLALEEANNFVKRQASIALKKIDISLL